MVKGAFIPIHFQTYQCSCGWEKIGDKRSVSLASKLHNKKNHAGAEICNTTFTEIDKISKSDAINRPTKPSIVPVPEGLYQKF